ncbi:hypothetical protein P3T20_004065 [Paraburkholderia sp. GAS206C]|uniref:hypothetical protein n=1 Tax=unclassified Paraburkholderia TaxID=2615204 RepID=UPI003D1E9BE4
MSTATFDRKRARRALKIRDAIPLESAAINQFEKLVQVVDRLARLSPPEKRIITGQVFVPVGTQQCKPERLRYSQEYEFIRTMTARADSRYTKPRETKELVCALSVKSNPGAWALSCGDFDAVVVSTALIDKVSKLAEYFVNTMFGPMSRDGMPPITFTSTFLGRFRDHSNESRNALKHLIDRTALNYILGHEFGHLAQGHLTRAAVGEPPDDGAETADGEPLMSVDSVGSCSNSPQNQARELDADVQGWHWAKNAFLALHAPDGPDRERIAWQVLDWIQEDIARVSFALTAATQIAYLSLGAEQFDVVQHIRDGTHPPTSLRAMVATDTIIVASLGSNEVANRGALDYSAEARLTAALAATIDALEMRSDDDSNAQDLARELKGMNFRDAGNRGMVVLGVAPPTPKNRGELDTYLNTLASEKRRIEVTARWNVLHTVQWTTSGIAAMRDSRT